MLGSLAASIFFDAELDGLLPDGCRQWLVRREPNDGVRGVEARYLPLHLNAGTPELIVSSRLGAAARLPQ
jgi:hypothetical protein